MSQGLMSQVVIAEHEVVIAGGGPTGMMLAAELALAGTDVVIVERRAGQEVEGSRARGLHSRTIEVLDQRGVAERFTSAGQTHPRVSFSMIPLDVTDCPSRHNYLLALGQSHFERILAEWVAELGVPVVRSTEVVGLTQDGAGVDVELSGTVESSAPTVLRAGYLVGCDGGRSVVRKAAGIDFPGLDPTTSWIMAEVDMDDPELGVRREGGGIGPLDATTGGGPYGVVVREQQVGPAGEPTAEDLGAALFAAYGTDFAARDATWISRFTDVTRQAASYRAGRVLLAGDAAHVHPPQGGLGLDTGVQDAVNLGWKLARVVAGTSPPGLLDTYHAERHPVGARVARTSMSQIALGTTDARHEALREAVAELLGMDEPRRRYAAMLSGLDVHYDLGDGHPLVGRRMPDLDVHTSSGPTRVYRLLHEARPVLLDLGSPAAGPDVAPWADLVRTVGARCEARWELPVVGDVAPPAAVLIRPDGYVAWVGDLTDPELPVALARWCGSAAAA